MTDSNPDARGSAVQNTIRRRTVITTGAGIVTASLAGCSTVVNFLAGFALDDVNVFNTSDQDRSGTIEVTDPDGETVLDEQFDLVPEDEAEDDQSGAVYGDVLDGSGDYTVVVELDAEMDPDGNDSDGNESDGADGENGSNETDAENGSTETGDENGTSLTEAVNDGGQAATENSSNESDADDAGGGAIAGRSVEETVEVSTPDEEHVAVILGADDADEPIQVVVIEEFSDLAEYLEDG